MAVRQLARLGLSPTQVRLLIAKRLLHRLHRGVYAVGHTSLTLRGRWMAAVLAAGPGAALSHRPALTLHGVRAAPSGPIDVTVACRGRRQRAGIRLHAVRHLGATELTRVDGIPVTSLSRTLLDSAAILKPQQLRTVLEAADLRGLLDGGALSRTIASDPHHRGAKHLRATLAELGDEPPWTQSETERQMLELIRSAGLPEPSVNVVVEGELVDFCWPTQRLVIEVDAWGTHGSRRSFESDRRRDARLTLAGWRPVRVTRNRIHHEPHRLADDITRLLAQANR